MLLYLAPRSLAGKIISALLVLALLAAMSGGLTPRRALAAPAITTISPAGGIVTGATTITITGSGFITGATVTFGGVPATNVTFVSATQLTGDTPANPVGPVTVVVTNPDTTAATLTNGFTYQDPPTVASIAPTLGPSTGATTITITGTNFTGATGVSFGGIPAPGFTVVNATTITAGTPPRTSAGTVDVAVTNYAGTGTLSAAFTYTSSPAIAFISPTSGPVTGGTLIIVTGTGFVNGAVVTFGGIPSSTVAFVNDTRLTATAPPKVAGAVDIGVRNPDGQTATLTGAYTYTSGPAITKVTPAIGPLSGGTAITVEGTGFQPGATVFIGGLPASGVVITSASKISAITAANGAGSATVTVINPDGLSITSIGAFTYADPPTVVSVTPNTGPATGGTKITISGTGFAIGATVTVGGEAATSAVWVNATTLTAVTAKNTKSGLVDIAVKNPNGMEGTGTALFTYESGTSPAASATPTSGTCTLTPNGGTFTKARMNFVVAQSCGPIADVITTAQKKVGIKVASVWYYDAANDAWSFFIPGFTPTAKGIGDLTTVPAALASLIVVTE